MKKFNLIQKQSVYKSHVIQNDQLKSQIDAQSYHFDTQKQYSETHKLRTEKRCEIYSNMTLKAIQTLSSKIHRQLKFNKVKMIFQAWKHVIDNGHKSVIKINSILDRKL